MWRDWAKSQEQWAKRQIPNIPFLVPSKRARGTLKYALLMALRDQPLHGYAIIKAIEGTYGYPPSPGTVYPTLQMLEDQGFLLKTQLQTKKVYTLTDDGRRCLDEHRDEVDRIETRAHMPRWNSIPGISTKLTEIARVILANYQCLDDNKVKKIENILEDARKHIGQIIFERWPSGPEICSQVPIVWKKEVIDMNDMWVDLIAAPLPQCIKCKNLDRGTLQCPAFGDKPIPDDIQLNLSDHRYPYPGDHGVLFEERRSSMLSGEHSPPLRAE